MPQVGKHVSKQHIATAMGPNTPSLWGTAPRKCVALPFMSTESRSYSRFPRAKALRLKKRMGTHPPQKVGGAEELLARRKATVKEDRPSLPLHDKLYQVKKMMEEKKENGK